MRDAIEPLDLKPFDKTQYKEQLAHHMAAKELGPHRPRSRRASAAATAQGARAAAMTLASKSQRTTQPANARPQRPPLLLVGRRLLGQAAPSAAAAPAPPVPEFNPRRRQCRSDRLAAPALHTRAISSSRTPTCSVRGGIAACAGARHRRAYQRLMRDAGQLEKGFSAADSDLLFMQTLARSGVPLEDASGMGFHEFCRDELMELARRKAAQARGDSGGSGGASRRSGPTSSASWCSHCQARLRRRRLAQAYTPKGDGAQSPSLSSAEAPSVA